MKTTLLFFVLFLSFPIFSLASEDDPNDGKIDVIYPAEQLADYKQRRSNWGMIFGFAGEQIKPTKFRSKIDSQDFSSLFGGTAMSAGHIEFGLKYNFMLGSIGASLLYGNGGAHSSKVNDGRSLNLTKKAAQITYTMDNLFDIPYVAPYGGAQFVTWSWTESSINPGTTKDGSTSMTGGIILGLLFQLDWLLPDESLAARNSSGVENTFLDVFVTQYNASTNVDDQNFATDMNYGLGIKVEY